MKKEVLKRYLEEYSLTYDYEEDYTNIYNACIDYMNDTQDWSIEYCFQDWLTYEQAEELAKNELENGGLTRLYYFLGNVNCNNDLFKIDGYGNLEDITSEDLKDLISSILEELEEEN